MDLSFRHRLPGLRVHSRRDAILRLLYWQFRGADHGLGPAEFASVRRFEQSTADEGVVVLQGRKSSSPAWIFHIPQGAVQARGSSGWSDAPGRNDVVRASYVARRLLADLVGLDHPQDP